MWTAVAPVLRVAAGGLLAWGLVILALAPQAGLDTTGTDADEPAADRSGQAAHR